MASPVLRSPDLIAVVVSYQDGLPQDFTIVQRLADAVELTPCSNFINEDQTGYLAHVPARFASLPYLQRYPHPTTKLPHHALHLSIVEGDVALVQQWLRWDASLCTSATLELAAAASQGPILRLLFEQFPTLATPKMMDLVAMSGDLELLKWLHEADAACTTDAMDGAAMNGHHDIVRFLHFARTEGCTITAATAATVHGHASIVRFLLEQRTEGVDPSLNFKVPHGAHKTQSLTDHAFTMIVDKGGLATLQHVYARGYLRRMTKPLLELAVAKQDHEMLRYVLACIDQEHPRPPCDDEWLPTDMPDKIFLFDPLDPSPFDQWEGYTAMELAALNGDMTSLKLLHASRLRVGSERAIVFAAYGGHMHVLEWLHKNRRDGCGEDALALVTAAGHFDAVRWLHEVYGLCRTHAALATAAYIGHMAMVTYLLDVPTGGVDSCTDPADDNSSVVTCPPQRDGHLGNSGVDYVRGSPTYWAASQGHIAILELLVARGYELPPNAIEKAVTNGHLRVVRFLHESFDQRCDRHAIVMATLGTHVDTIAYVLSRRCWQLGSSTSHDDIPLPLLVATARSGSLDILKLVRDAFQIPAQLPARVSERMMVRATSYGRLDMLRHLHDVYGFGWTPMVEEAARRRGRKDVLRYLQTLGPLEPSVYGTGICG